ncbi:MAG: 2Fe-2S iron-sulfur cluster-binding protein [Novosphingobium sp.]
MPKVEILCPDGTNAEVVGSTGMTLMEAIRASGVDELLALCGGGLSCGTCHVYVLDPTKLAALPPMDIEEQELLESFSNFSERSRLSCQLDFASVPDGLRLELASAD